MEKSDSTFNKDNARDRSATREVVHVSHGQRATDGDGVKLTRIIGTPELSMIDPFLLLDAFESDNPDDYIGGFPNHPHRGFETVTYLLAGQMRHRDSAGNEGVIKPGGVQWMTAGRGIVHSEMPEQVDGLLMGFQLWVNLPASAKMSEPGYQEFPAEQVALEQWPSGSTIRVIAGRTNAGTDGAVNNDFVTPLYMDVQLKAGDDFDQSIPPTHNAFLYHVDGDVSIGQAQTGLGARTLAVLGEGDGVWAHANKDSRFILIAGQPLNEPVARGGPFVMNTQAELRQAFDDFQNNRF